MDLFLYWMDEHILQISTVTLLVLYLIQTIRIRRLKEFLRKQEKILHK
jgi:hypothetical protein